MGVRGTDEIFSHLAGRAEVPTRDRPARKGACGDLPELGAQGTETYGFCGGPNADRRTRAPYGLAEKAAPQK